MLSIETELRTSFLRRQGKFPMETEHEEERLLIMKSECLKSLDRSKYKVLKFKSTGCKCNCKTKRCSCRCIGKNFKNAFQQRKTFNGTDCKKCRFRD